MTIIIKSGGIIYKKINKKNHLLLIGVAEELENEEIKINWQFPKGKLEEKEELAECALREVFEETSVKCEIDEFLDKFEFMGKKKSQLIYYYMMKPISEGLFTPDKKIQKIKWVPIDKIEINRFITGEFLAKIKKFLDEKN